MRDFSKEGYLAQLLDLKPDMLVPTLSNDLLDRVTGIISAAAAVRQTADNFADSEKIKRLMDTVLHRTTDIVNIAHALRAYDELQKRPHRK